MRSPRDVRLLARDGGLWMVWVAQPRPISTEGIGGVSGRRLRIKQAVQGVRGWACMNAWLLKCGRYQSKIYKCMAIEMWKMLKQTLRGV
eukprot:1141959-Pelagomonas_calceolata.AAC.2